MTTDNVLCTEHSVNNNIYAPADVSLSIIATRALPRIKRGVYPENTAAGTPMAHHVMVSILKIDFGLYRKT